MEAGKERLTRDVVRDATQHEVEALRRENVELKQLVAELSLEGYRLRLLQDPDDLLPCVPLPCHQPSLSILFYRRTLLLTDTVFGGKVSYATCDGRTRMCRPRSYWRSKINPR